MVRDHFREHLVELAAVVLRQDLRHFESRAAPDAARAEVDLADPFTLPALPTLLLLGLRRFKVDCYRVTHAHERRWLLGRDELCDLHERRLEHPVQEVHRVSVCELCLWSAWSPTVSRSCLGTLSLAPVEFELRIHSDFEIIFLEPPF